MGSKASLKFTQKPSINWYLYSSLLAAMEKIPNMAIVVPKVLGERLSFKGVVSFEGGVTEGARRATGVTPPSAHRNWYPLLPA
jgi:hypothetical protein